MRKAEVVSLSALTIVASITIIESAYLGINGNHVFRQADVYGNLLGILHIRDFSLFDLFSERKPWGNSAVFDLPVYQYLVALTSWLLHKDPLVSVRYINLGMWLITAGAGYYICSLLNNRLAGVFFIALLSTSRIFLHYYSVPLPDIMAIAFSMVATAILIREEYHWRYYLLALAFVLLAASIKSPIPFVFLIFAATYKIQSGNISGSSLIKKIQQQLPLLSFLLVCLCFVLLIEYYRSLLMSQTGSKSGHLWQWYFGSIDLRLSWEFWNTILKRFDRWFPGFLLFFIVVSYAVKRWHFSEKNRIIFISALFSFFSGWLIFSKVYKIHDYYQLPIAIIMFISFASSLSCLVGGLERKKLLSPWFLRFLPLFFTALLLLQLALIKPYSVKSRTSFWTSVEYALEKDKRFLLVSDDLNNPAVGGRVSTRFVGINQVEFEENCHRYLSEYAAILLEYPASDCIDSAKAQASQYISDEKRIFFRGTR